MQSKSVNEPPSASAPAPASALSSATPGGRTPGHGARVTVNGVDKTFPLRRGQLVHALRDVDLELGVGEFVAIVGPSGCGKSTLLRLLAGLDQPSKGTVRIDGREPADMARAHRLGVAFQDHALLPWLSVTHNVALPFTLAGLAVDHDRVGSLIETVGLADFSDARPKQLSGGMRQRVSIARSLVLSPSLLLLDEPFGALDLITRRALNLELQRIWTELGTTTLLITHSVEEAVQLADRVVVMRSRPGQPIRDMAVDLPRPRTRDVMSSALFVDVVQELTDALDDARVA